MNEWPHLEHKNCHSTSAPHLCRMPCDGSSPDHIRTNFQLQNTKVIPSLPFLAMSLDTCVVVCGSSVVSLSDEQPNEHSPKDRQDVCVLYSVRDKYRNQATGRVLPGWIFCTVSLPSAIRPHYFRLFFARTKYGVSK